MFTGVHAVGIVRFVKITLQMENEGDREAEGWVYQLDFDLLFPYIYIVSCKCVFVGVHMYEICVFIL